MRRPCSPLRRSFRPRALAASAASAAFAASLALACSSAAPAPEPAPEPATADAKSTTSKKPATEAANAPTKAAEPATPPRRLLFETDDGFGYRDPFGAVVIPAKYPMAQEFSEAGIAAVVDDKGWAIIDTKGAVLLRPFVFDNGPDAFQEGRARFVKDDKVGFFDERGAVVIEATYEHAEPFRRDESGRISARVCKGCKKVQHGEHWSAEGGTWSLVDVDGKPLPDPPDAKAK